MSSSESSVLNPQPWTNGVRRLEHPRLVKLKGFTSILLQTFGSVIGFIWYMSWLPFVLLVSPRVYRMLADFFGAWWCHIPVIISHYLFRIKIVVSGDALDPADHSAIFISNHVTYYDWWFLWEFFFRQQRILHEKIILKKLMKFMPGYGWAMQMMKFFFLGRNNDPNDRPHLARMFKSYASARYPIQLLLFPEGTITDQEGIDATCRFARSRNLPLRRHTLYPKDGAFVMAVSALRSAGLTSVYDITLGYPDLIPSFAELVAGEMPYQIHVHLKRYPISSLPETDAELGAWLSRVWEEKNKRMEDFNENRIAFDPSIKLVPSGTVVRQTPFSFTLAEKLRLFVVLLIYLFLIFLVFTFLNNITWTSFLFGLIMGFIVPTVVTYFGGYEILELWRTNC